MMKRWTFHVALFLVGILFANAANAAELSRVDRADVEKVLNAYVARWLANDADGVMKLLTNDSVLIPGEKPPIAGQEAIRNYWFPSTGPKTTLQRYTTTHDRLTGDADTAVVRGTQVIEWTTGGERWRTHGNYVTVLTRTSGGWRIATQMAANAPSEHLR